MSGHAPTAARLAQRLIERGLDIEVTTPNDSAVPALGAEQMYWGNIENDTISFANLDNTGGGNAAICG